MEGTRTRRVGSWRTARGQASTRTRVRAMTRGAPCAAPPSGSRRQSGVADGSRRPESTGGVAIADQSLPRFADPSLRRGVTPLTIAPGSWRCGIIDVRRARRVQGQTPPKARRRGAVVLAERARTRAERWAGR
jgi:hypothetical protein